MPAPTRAEIRQLDTAQTNAVQLAQRELGKVWRELDGMSPAQQRDILLEILPALINKYGDVTSVGAAEWYQALWDKFFGDGSGSGFQAMPDNPADDATLRRVIRAKAGLLFDGPDGANPEAFLTWANKFLDRNVKAGGRQTVRTSALHDPKKPRYARIPSGVRTCPFCLMLASRGAVYATEQTAGVGHEFHDDCHCEVAPEWGKGGLDHIEGYDLSLYERVYDDARRALENPDSMSEDLRATVFGGSEYTVNITQKNGRVRHVTYAAGDQNNVNALALVMRAQHPELFRD